MFASFTAAHKGEDSSIIAMVTAAMQMQATNPNPVRHNIRIFERIDSDHTSPQAPKRQHRPKAEKNRRFQR